MVDVVIVGAGAAGLMCACTLKKNNSNIKFVLLEKNDKTGKKLAITGNGKCNLGNTDKSINNYYSSSSLDAFKNVLEEGLYLHYLKEFGVYIKEEKGLLYPNSNQAIGVVKAFERYIGYNIKYNYHVKSVDKMEDYFIINNDIKCKYLVVATGGSSHVETGSIGEGYELLNKYHSLINPIPALAPLLSENKYLKDVLGVRCDCKVSLIKDNKVLCEELGQVQFIDHGLSGICIFNLSRYFEKGSYVNIDLIPNIIDEDLIEFINKFNTYTIEDALSNVINNKLAKVVAKQLNILGKKVRDIDVKLVVNQLHNLKIDTFDTKGFGSAQITRGGLKLDEFNADLSSKICDNLYVIGEILDVDGKCGGYNLSWAFTSALIAANSIAKKF